MGKGAICRCVSCRYVVSFFATSPRVRAMTFKTASLMSGVAGRPKPAFGWRSAVLGS
jgi:hypothetical protein